MSRIKKLKNLQEKFSCQKKIGFWILLDLLIKEKTGTKSSTDVNTRKSIQLINLIGYNDITEYSQSKCDLFISELHLKYEPSTFNDYRTILIDSFERALNDNVIVKSPFDNLKALKCPVKPIKVYNKQQISLLVPSNKNMTIEKALITLALCTGVRTNELIAITADAYNADKKILYIDQSLVFGMVKNTKTDGSTRVVELNEYAINALEYLINLTKDYEETSYNFYIGKKIHEKRKSIFIAINPNTGQRFFSSDEFRKKFFVPYCFEVGVDYLPPKHLRHTYISQMLTAGAPMTWIIKQVGHMNYEMIKKHYGRWINEDSRKSQELISDHFDYLFEPNEKRSIYERIKGLLGLSVKKHTRTT